MGAMELVANGDERESSDKVRNEEPIGASTLRSGKFSWSSTSALIGPAVRRDDPCDSIKDPSVISFDGRWHLFASIRSHIRTHQVEYMTFNSWSSANAATRHVLKITDGFFGAPQVFLYEPHRLWYLVYQVKDDGRTPAVQPAFSTTSDIADPWSWTSPKLLFEEHPPNVEMWLDYWIICDESDAHLFFTSLNGLMWHAQTDHSQFPHGWSEPSVVLKGDVYEASHTYKLAGMERYLTMIEAVADGRRYFKAYTSASLSGQWEPLADSLEKPLAGVANVTFTADEWTTSFSHGEFLRVGVNQFIEIDPGNLRIVYQGVSDDDRQGKEYGKIPWRLGLLRNTERPWRG